MPTGGAKIQVTFPQVRVQVTMIQINEQVKECLLSLISKQNVLFQRGDSTWFGNLLMEQ